MNFYHLCFFATFLIVSAKPMPEISLDPLLPDLFFAEAPEDWSFVQRDPTDSTQPVHSDSLQTAALDATQRDQPVSFQIPAVGRVQQDQSGTFQVPAVNQIQQDQSGSFQVAAADRIEPVNPYFDPLQIDSEDDASSYLAPMTTDDDNLLAATPKKPKTQVRVNAKKGKVCPSYVLPARACCDGPERLITGVNGLNPLILGYTFVTRCYACRFSLPNVKSPSFSDAHADQKGCINGLTDWCCMYLMVSVISILD